MIITGKLADRAKELSPFLTIDDSESVVGQYMGWKEMVSPFDPKQVLFQYELEVGGIQKFWKSGNKKIALFFDKLKKGEYVKITRHGVDRDTRYEVEHSVDESGTLTVDEAHGISEEMAG